MGLPTINAAIKCFVFFNKNIIVFTIQFTFSGLLTDFLHFNESHF